MINRPKNVGEVDQKGHVKVLCPTPTGGLTACWVKITEGDKCRGRGIVDDDKANAGLYKNGRLQRIKLGDPIEYNGGSERIRPKFVKTTGRNKKKVLIEDLKRSLEDAMLFKPR